MLTRYRGAGGGGGGGGPAPPPICNYTFDCDLHDPVAVSLERRLASRASRDGRLVLYLVGDSLVMGQFYGLCKLATGELPDQTTPHPEYAMSCQSAELYAIFLWSPGYNASVARWLVTEHPPPDVVYFDGGVHLLHLHPGRPMQADMFERLLHFQERLQSFVLAWSAAAPGARLSVMPPNAICPEKFFGRWRKIAEDPHRSAKLCADDMLAGGAAPQEAVASICERFPFTDVGARNIQQAINQAVQGLPMPAKEKTLVVDQHALTTGHCSQTCDGRHYKPLVLRQLDLFFWTNGW
uniref:Uncharacterized protein n=1 Tax=Alexandrium catenella TaxID=2925 RepID=A0A7S1RBT6_ALECA